MVAVPFEPEEMFYVSMAHVATGASQGALRFARFVKEFFEDRGSQPAD